MIGFASSPRFVEHLTGAHHPERPDRIRAIHRAVRDAGLIRSPDPFPDFKMKLGVPAQHALQLAELPVIEADEAWIRMIHPQGYIDRIRDICQAGGGVLDLGDTPVGSQSFQIARLSLGSALAATDAVMRGKVRRAFSAARPPGHHAEPHQPMGFCLFSNMVIAASYARKVFELSRIAIVDFDVHHGNGTQAAFEQDPSVLFISLHQHPRTCYPGSGYAYETGEGAGVGYTLNVPLDPGTDDEEYLRAMDEQVIPRLDAFNPQLLMISAGFDAHREDPLAQLNLSDDGFAQITDRLVAVAEAHCGGKVVSILEGGYNLPALGRSVVRHLLSLGGNR
jgi:acetoin utilization deacetylase AcuC-like enzyme